MSIFLPFNFRPASTERKTGSYSVPANQYARVTPYNATFQLGSGNYVYQEKLLSGTQVSNANNSGYAQYGDSPTIDFSAGTANLDNFYVGPCYVMVTWTSVVAGGVPSIRAIYIDPATGTKFTNDIYKLNNSGTYTLQVPGGCAVTVGNSSGSGTYDYTYRYLRMPAGESFWVTSNTSLTTGMGDYLVELFNIPNV